jgi:hypothetical protein
MIKYWQRCEALLQWGSIVLNDTVTVSNVTDSITIKDIHRGNNTTNIYFIANTAHRSGTATCSFNSSSLQPELWDPVTGIMRNLPQFEEKDGKTILSLSFDDAQSYFIVFRNKAIASALPAKDNFPLQKQVVTLKNSWMVQFDTVWGGPAKPVRFSNLQDWTTSTERGIKYFSGTAKYHTSFDMPAAAIKTKNSTLYLDLGTVKHIAHVMLNDQDLGIVWTAPWHIKIPANLLKAKGNSLTIEVTNVWANRLIGDEQEPDDCEWLPSQYMYNSGKYLKEFPDWFLNKQPRPSKGRYCFTTWNYFDKNSPLIPSGLLGPVTITKEE